MQLQYLSPLTVDDTATVETRYMAVAGAKLCFEYTVRRDRDGAVVARGSSMQVFVDAADEMALNCPPFYEEWKAKWLKQ